MPDYFPPSFFKNLRDEGASLPGAGEEAPRRDEREKLYKLAARELRSTTKNERVRAAVDAVLAAAPPSRPSSPEREEAVKRVISERCIAKGAYMGWLEDTVRLVLLAADRGGGTTR